MDEEKACTSRVVRVGSRKSELALIQTGHVISLLKEIHREKSFEIVTMSTLGDQILDKPLPKIGEKSLFTRELETALITGVVDLVVHSLKDLPTTLPEGMAIGAVLTREDPRDALVLRKDCQHLSLETLPDNSVIGTSSLRRTAQLAKKYPQLKVESIRGNLNTRLKKLDELGDFHAIILATAGLNRMGWNQRISKVIEEHELLYAVGQGALAVECRQLDKDTLQLLKPLYDPKTAIQVIAERSFLRTLGGGCSAPVAVTTNLTSTRRHFKLSLTGAVWSLNGKEEIMKSDEASVEIKEINRCTQCPYYFKNNIKNVSGKNKCNNSDIECFKKCSFKRIYEETNEVITKRQKSETDMSKELLKTDPLVHCPMKIPIGLDFMGKCPYIDTRENLTKECPVYGKGQIDGMDGDFNKCPFLKENVLQSILSTDLVEFEKHGNNGCLYVGLVPHEDVPEISLNEAENLGNRLAKKLIELGATEIMNKAQEFIRNS
ncbi:hypothetical protein FQA39_LY05067 [Lamprigera yunnana]|nr:hypothetical protein FQA39_LY05067 [Lamprigera yunnana]